MSATTYAQPVSKGANITAWVVQVLLAAAFLGAAGAKLASVPMMVEVFDQIGLGQGFRFVTAIVEITGALLLLVPGFAALGAVLLGVTMVFAFAAHMLVLHSNPGGAVLLFALSMVVVWLRKPQFAALRARFL
jgi:putative oxidoreductase